MLQYNYSYYAEETYMTNRIIFFLISRGQTGQLVDKLKIQESLIQLRLDILDTLDTLL